jgi:hypothetical protein
MAFAADRSAPSPWHNGYADRLIGSIRRECLDHVVVVGERHLRHVLASYLANELAGDLRPRSIGSPARSRAVHAAKARFVGEHDA